MNSFKLSDNNDFKKISKNLKNRRNRARRKERKKEWKANNPKPTTTENVRKESEKHESLTVNDVLKAVSDGRKKVKK